MIRIEIKTNEESQTVKCSVKVVEGEFLAEEIFGLLSTVEKIANDHKSEMKRLKLWG